MQLFSFPSLSLLKTVFRPLSIIVWTRTRMMLIRAAFVNPITNGGAIALLKNSDATSPVSRCTGTLRQILTEVSTCGNARVACYQYQISENNSPNSAEDNVFGLHATYTRDPGFKFSNACHEVPGRSPTKVSALVARSGSSTRAKPTSAKRALEQSSKTKPEKPSANRATLAPDLGVQDLAMDIARICVTGAFRENAQ
jgi:hypothetical protein